MKNVKKITIRILFLLFAGAAFLTCTSDKSDKVIADPAKIDSPKEEYPWDPAIAVSTDDLPQIRDYRLQKGLIHAHSTYSHDGCDNYIDRNDGEPDLACVDDLRTSFCTNKIDFAMMTDHASYMADFTFEELLFLTEDDQPIYRNDVLVANLAACPEGGDILLTVGSENHIEFSGLEGHISEDKAARKDVYRGIDAESVKTWQEHGAVAFISHTEGKDLEYIRSLPVNGIEIYNLHANLFSNLQGAADAFAIYLNTKGMVPHPDLSFLSIYQLDMGVISKWDALTPERNTVGIFATDVHRNSLPMKMADGERIDGYRRMSHWFSNFVMVDSASELDPDQALKEAVRSGRMFGVVEALGVPVGFDFHLEDENGIAEIGSTVDFAAGQKLVIEPPRLFSPTSFTEPAVITAKLYRAYGSGVTGVIESGESTIEFEPTEPGVYRAVIEILPNHLRPWLGPKAEYLIREYSWVVSNPIYIGVANK